MKVPSGTYLFKNSLYEKMDENSDAFYKIEYTPTTEEIVVTGIVNITYEDNHRLTLIPSRHDILLEYIEIWEYEE